MAGMIPDKFTVGAQGGDMIVDHLGVAVLEHVNHMGCRTKVMMDDLWECLADVPARCPDMITYGPVKYCLHKDHVGFGAGAERCVGDASK
jgi:hypothetical protein